MQITSAADRFAAFRHRSYSLFFTSRVLAGFSTQIISVAVGWQMYDVTKSPFLLGMIGLAQFMPSLLLILVTGSVTDRYNRRAIVAICLTVSAACAAALVGLTMTGTFAPLPVFAILVVFGIERAFMGAASQSLAPNLVPEKDLANSLAWNASSWQAASITGPVAGGFLYGLGPIYAYSVAFGFMVVGAVLIYMIPKPQQRKVGEPTSWSYILAGFTFIRSEKVVLGAISLDLFVVLLGGAVALMPIFASEVLVLGPIGLGLLRAAPGVGGIAMAFFLATFPIRHGAGVKMFIGVACFGLGTLLFGLSQTAWLSIVALALMGAGDMVSVYVRETLIALWTPDEVRGRVNAVNSVFVGASNELGEFRAGTMAHFIGAVPAVVIGGIGALIVSAAWAGMFPRLRKIDTLEAPERPASSQAIT